MERELPRGWVWVRLGEVGRAVTGTTPTTTDSSHYGGPLPFFKPTDLDAGYYVREAREYLSASGEAKSRVLPARSVLVTCIGATIGKTGLARVRCATNQQINAFVPTAEVTQPEWAYWWLNSPQAQDLIISNASATTLPILNKSKFEALPFPVAPLAEQARIVAAIEQHLSDIDAGVVALERALHNLRRYRAAVLKAACEGKLVPTEAELARQEGRGYEPGEVLLERVLTERRARWEAGKRRGKYEEPKGPETGELGALPEGWVWTTIETVGDVLLGRQRAPQYLTGKWSRPYLRVANVKDDRIDFEDVETMDFDPEHLEKYRLQPDDILVSEGQSPDRVGESAIYQGGIDGLCFQKTLHRFRPVPSGPPAKFAQIVFRSHVKTGVFRKMASITTNIAHLTLEKFEAAPFPLPPLAEQHRIVAEVDRLLSVADQTETALRAQLARAERLRQSVLARAFEGKLVPQDPADEPASVLLERLRAEPAQPATPTPRPRRASRRRTAAAEPAGE